MCLIALAWQAHPRFTLVVAANRDEWRDRPTLPAHWWPDSPKLLAGQDQRAGGTWLGITPRGRFAAITNFRDPSDRKATALSRGTLVTEYLLGADPPREFLLRLGRNVAAFNGFNLIVGDGTSLWYLGSREGEPRVIPPGVHALSNHVLNEPWPKVRFARQAMESAVLEEDPAPRLFAMLAGRDPAPDAELPDTGIGLELERRLSAALITGEDYGSRCSTVLVQGSHGEFAFEERTLDAAGNVAGTVVERFSSDANEKL